MIHRHTHNYTDTYMHSYIDIHETQWFILGLLSQFFNLSKLQLKILSSYKYSSGNFHLKLCYQYSSYSQVIISNNQKNQLYTFMLYTFMLYTFMSALHIHARHIHVSSTHSCSSHSCQEVTFYLK